MAMTNNQALNIIAAQTKKIQQSYDTAKSVNNTGAVGQLGELLDALKLAQGALIQMCLRDVARSGAERSKGGNMDIKGETTNKDVKGSD